MSLFDIYARGEEDVKEACVVIQVPLRRGVSLHLVSLFFFLSLLFVRLSSFRSLRIVVVPFLFVVVLLDDLVSSSSRLRLG